MNRVDSNKPNVTFGIAFKKIKNKNGVVSAELLDFKEELKMYKNMEKSLNNDFFLKKTLGITSRNTTILKEDTKQQQGMRFFDGSGEYYMVDNGTKLNNISPTFQRVRSLFDNLFNKKI